MTDGHETWSRPGDARPATRWARRAALVVLALAGVAVVGLVTGTDEEPPDDLAIEDDEAPSPDEEADPTAPPDEPSPDPGDGGEVRAAGGEWSDLREAPLEPRTTEAAWTGAELIVWGGQAEGSLDRPIWGDGAAYDPGADAWRALQTSPLGARGGHITVWTGEELVVWGGQSRTRYRDDGATYDPEEDRWLPLPASPLSPRSNAAAAWVGDVVLVAGGRDAAGMLRDAAIYDPAERQWHELDIELPSSIAGGMPQATTVGDEAFVWSPGGFVPNRQPPRLLRYDADGEAWNELDPPDLLAAESPTTQLVAAGERLLAVASDGPPGGRPELELWDGDGWEEVPLPSGVRTGTSRAQHWTPTETTVTATRERVYLVDDPDEPLALDLADEEWSELPAVDADLRPVPGVDDPRPPGPVSYDVMAVGRGLLLWTGGLTNPDGQDSPPGIYIWRPER